jgi:hypothetical protein
MCNCMVSWNVNSFWVGAEIPCDVYDPKVYYRVHKKKTLEPILSKLNTVQNFTPCFLNARFEVSKAMKIQVEFFCVVIPCSFVVEYLWP